MPEEAAKTPALPGKAEAAPQARKLRQSALQSAPKPVAETKPAPVDQTNKVVHIVQRMQEDASRRFARKKRNFWLPVSLALAIAVPTIVAAIYYTFIAADQYVSEAQFAVRANDAQAADVLGLVSGMPRATVVSDSYIVADFVISRDMVEILERRLPLREIYANPAADFLTRLDPDVTIEEMVKYWNRRIDVFFDPTKNTITLRVQAFTPQDAERIASVIIESIRSLVNDLSAQSRRDAVQFAAVEVARAELRVRGARDNMLAFRSENRQFDPAATAEAALTIVGTLEAEQSSLNSQLAALSGYLAEDAPSIQMLRSRIAALQAESERIQDQIANGEIPAELRPVAPPGKLLNRRKPWSACSPSIRSSCSTRNLPRKPTLRRSARWSARARRPTARSPILRPTSIRAWRRMPPIRGGCSPSSWWRSPPS